MSMRSVSTYRESAVRPSRDFPCPMRRISARVSAETAGPPGRPRRTFEVQNVRNVSDASKWLSRASLSSTPRRTRPTTRESSIRNSRSALFNRTRLFEPPLQAPMVAKRNVFKLQQRAFHHGRAHASIIAIHLMPNKSVYGMCNPHHVKQSTLTRTKSSFAPLQ